MEEEATTHAMIDPKFPPRLNMIREKKSMCKRRNGINESGNCGFQKKKMKNEKRKTTRI